MSSQMVDAIRAKDVEEVRLQESAQRARVTAGVWRKIDPRVPAHLCRSRAC